MSRSLLKSRSPSTGPLAWALTLLLLLSAGCDVTDPRLDDLRVAGSVTDAAGQPIAGATVSLVRMACPGSCGARTRGADVTGTDARFDIVVERDDDEQSSWDLVCHEFTVSIEASGYAPIAGNYQAWRGPFCASGEVVGIEFTMEPA